MKSTDIIKASTNSLNIYSFTAEALERLIDAVKAEQPCPTCEALARTVMLDQTSHDAQRKPWVGLTRPERFEIEQAMSKYYDYRHECKTVCLPEFAAAIEAKLREKNAQPSKPLTDEQIEQCMKQAYAIVKGRNLEHAFARAIEQAHGITGEKK